METRQSVSSPKDTTSEGRSYPLDAPVTKIIAERALGISAASAPENIRILIKQCLLDWIGVTIAGAHEPLARILREELSHQGGYPQATIIGDNIKLPTYQAALLNGSASHALDYDDVNHSLQGHPSVAIIPAILALSEDIGANGADFMDAFLAGYETSNIVGLLVGPSHYYHGFHATGTVGGFGAAAACSRLLKLNTQQTSCALGIAAARAAGIKSMFGTFCKPLHAGQAAMTGLMAASLAKRGFDSRADALECAQGFAATYSKDFNVQKALSAPPGGFHILSNLFKFNASCFETQAAIECGKRLRSQYDIDSSKIRSVVVRVNTACNDICNISEPKTALESKFSLRLTTAFALSGLETSSPSVFNDANAYNLELTNLRDKVKVELTPDFQISENEMTVEMIDGRRFHTHYDAGVPETDVKAQGVRLERKFGQLVSPFVNHNQAQQILQSIGGLDKLKNMSELTRLCTIER